jgi:hypothetical protein
MKSYTEYYAHKKCNTCVTPHPYNECDATSEYCPRLKPKHTCFDPVVDVFAGKVDPIQFHPYKEMNVEDIFSGPLAQIHSAKYREVQVMDVFATQCV